MTSVAVANKAACIIILSCHVAFGCAGNNVTATIIAVVVADQATGIIVVTSHIAISLAVINPAVIVPNQPAGISDTGNITRRIALFNEPVNFFTLFKRNIRGIVAAPNQTTSRIGTSNVTLCNTMGNITAIVVANQTTCIITIADNSTRRMAVADISHVVTNKTASIIVIAHNNSCCVTVGN